MPNGDDDPLQVLDFSDFLSEGLILNAALALGPPFSPSFGGAPLGRDDDGGNSRRRKRQLPPRGESLQWVTAQIQLHHH